VTLGLFPARAGRMEGMSEERQKGGGYAGWAIIAAVLVALPLLYFLSIGPAAWLMMEGRLSREAYEWFYYPVVPVQNNSRWCDYVIYKYVGLWVRNGAWH
jgi:hypothetical protein